VDLSTKIQKCTASSNNYRANKGGCITVINEDDEGNKLYAQVPGKYARLSSGDDNYNSKGEYTLVAGLYYICGEDYLNNPESSFREEFNIGFQEKEGYCDGDDIGTCPDGSKIVLQTCNMETNEWGTKTGLNLQDSCNHTEAKATQFSMTESDLKEATSVMILQSVCSLTENCMPYEAISGDQEYIVECKSTSSIKSKIDEAVKEKCTANVANWWKIGAGITPVVCGGAAAITLLSGGSLSPTLMLCALPGVAIGFGASAVSAGCQMANANAANGLCIATPTSTHFFCSFTSPLGEAFKISGDPCMDGLYIIIGAVLLVYLLPRLFPKKGGA